MKTYRYLSLFSGIGGFEIAAQIANQQIGLEAFQPAALCEINPFCQQVLQTHFPSIPLLPDVRNISVDLIRELGVIDGIVGGFPCQDVSNAGNRAGLAGERSGLFYEIIRIVRLVRPRFIYLENVAALAQRGLSDVLREFAQVGYDVQWTTIPCSTLGGSHRRERVWIIAYPNSDGRNDWAALERERHSSLHKQRHPAPSEPERKGWQCESGEVDVTPHTPSFRLQRCNDKAICDGVHGSRVCAKSPRIDSDGIQKRFNYEDAVKSLVRRCHDGLPVGVADDFAYLLRLVDIPDWLPFAADSLPIAYRKEALQALGNAIVPQVGAIGFLRIYNLLTT